MLPSPCPPTLFCLLFLPAPARLQLEPHHTRICTNGKRPTRLCRRFFSSPAGRRPAAGQRCRRETLACLLLLLHRLRFHHHHLLQQQHQKLHLLACPACGGSYRRLAVCACALVRCRHCCGCSGRALASAIVTETATTTGTASASTNESVTGPGLDGVNDCGSASLCCSRCSRCFCCCCCCCCQCPRYRCCHCRRWRATESVAATPIVVDRCQSRGGLVPGRLVAAGRSFRFGRHHLLPRDHDRHRHHHHHHGRRRGRALFDPDPAGHHHHHHHRRRHAVPAWARASACGAEAPLTRGLCCRPAVLRACGRRRPRRRPRWRTECSLCRGWYGRRG